MADLTRRAAIGALPLAAASCATQQPQSRLPTALEARLDAIFAGPAHPAPGYALGIFKDGEIALAKGYGFANLEDEIPIAPQTVFHLASLSKQFTAAAIALNILEGRVALDVPIAHYLPEFAGFASAVQLRHLVYMTSGLPEYTSLPRASGLPWFSSYRFTVSEAVAAVAGARQLVFTPGERWAYSNINYMLMAEIVARVQGVSFARFMREHVFAPLGMQSSLIDDDAMLPVPHRAIGYAARTPEVLRDLESVGVAVGQHGDTWLRMNRVSPHYGGSGVLSSVVDLYKWDANWTSHSLGGQPFHDLMHRRERFAHPKVNDAFGLVFNEYQGRPRIWYSGSDLDASSYFARFPDQRMTVVCLANNPAGQAEQRVASVLDALSDARFF